MLTLDPTTYPVLAPRALEAYDKWCALKKVRATMEKRAEELKKAMEAEEAIFRTQFSDTRMNLRIPGNLLLHCETIKVPQILHKAYQYNQYSEIAI